MKDKLSELHKIKKQFGIAVRKQRTKLAISQEELAHRSGLHRTYVTDIERGLRNISLENIYKIAKGLGLQVTKLFKRIETGD